MVKMSVLDNRPDLASTISTFNVYVNYNDLTLMESF